MQQNLRLLVYVASMCFIFASVGCEDSVEPHTQRDLVGYWDVRVDTGGSGAGVWFLSGSMDLKCDYLGLHGILTLGGVRYLVSGDCPASTSIFVEWSYSEITNSPFPYYRGEIDGHIDQTWNRISGTIWWNKAVGSDWYYDLYNFTATR